MSKANGLVFDEVYGFLPPHSANPPTKRPLVSLMKQAGAFGVGVVSPPRTPRTPTTALSANAGLWCIGRLQTDADRAHVIEGLCAASHVGGAVSADQLSDLAKRLSDRWFLLRDVHAGSGTTLMQPRWAMSFMKGPMTGQAIRRAREALR